MAARQNWCPKAQRSEFSSKAALHFRTPPATPKGVSRWLERSNRPATGHPT